MMKSDSKPNKHVTYPVAKGASEWINNLLYQRNKKSTNDVYDASQQYGIEILTTAELKYVFDRLSSALPFKASDYQWSRLRNLKAPRKAELAKAIQDEVNNIENDAAINRWTSSIPCRPIGVSSDADQNKMSYPQHVSITASSSSTNGKKKDYFISHHGIPKNSYNYSITTETSLQNNRTNTLITAFTTKKPKFTSTSVKVKTERHDSSTTTNTEINLLSKLRHVGFFNREECLNALRVTRESVTEYLSTNDWFEKASLYIVSQREEALEARRIDIARQMSEVEREKELKVHESTRLQTLRNSSLFQILNDEQFFIKDSILLSTPTSKSALQLQGNKQSAITYLQLEQKALKWYGNELPSSYFKSITHRIQHHLPDLIVELQTALFTLSEQNGMGVPKLFAGCIEKIINDDNNEVQIINCSNRKRKHEDKSNNVTADDNEVIEIA